MKAAVLVGDSVLKGLVSVSIYDTKPVYFLLNACKDIFWTKKEKKVYDPEQQKNISASFLQLKSHQFLQSQYG